MRLRLWIIFFGFWIPFGFNNALAEKPGGQSFSAKVTGVASGDSLVVLEGDKTHVIRLYGIMSPKKKERFHKKAKEHLEEISFGRRVEVETVYLPGTVKKYAIVRLGSRILNQEMVREGLAMVQNEACILPLCEDLKKAQQEAMDQGKGIWGSWRTKLQ